MTGSRGPADRGPSDPAPWTVDREPWTVRWLVRWAAPAHREELLGDLTELWHASLATRRGGRWRWARHALSAIWWSRRQRAIGAAPDGDAEEVANVLHEVGPPVWWR